MMKPHNLFLTIFTLMALAIGSGVLPKAAKENSESESETQTCPSGDMDCFLDTLFLINQDGSVEKLITIAQSLPPAELAASVINLAPSISLYPSAMAINSLGNSYVMDFTWHDPLGQQPAFCMYTCPKNARCTASRYRCQRSKNDGRIDGVWRTWIGYSVGPALPPGSTEPIDLNVIPISAPAGADPIGILEDTINKGGDIGDLPPSTIAVGDPVTIPQDIAAPPAADNGSGSESDNGGGNNDGGGNSCDCLCDDGRSCTQNSDCPADTSSGFNIPGVCGCPVGC